MYESTRTGNTRRLLSHAEEILAGIALVAVVAAVCWGVLTRYVTDQPATWAGEVAQIAFAWTVFLGAAACFKYEMHIGIDMLTRLLPDGVRAVTQLLADLLVLAFLAYVVWLAVLFNIEAWNDPTSVLRLPRTVVYGSVFVGFAFMTLRQIQLTLRRLAGRHEPMMSLPQPGEQGA
jgi:TRAP-type C4-dicarboxylate transport system permease small subunit